MISKSRFILWTSSLLIFCSIFFAINVQAFTVTVNMAGSGSGTITSSLDGMKCLTGSKSCTYTSSNNNDVTLTARPDENSSFINWSGAEKCLDNKDCTVNMKQDQTITATFAVKNEVAQLQAKFAGLNLGIGLGAIYWVQNDVGVAEAVVSNGIVRVTKTNKSWAGVILETHYFFTPTWGDINKCDPGKSDCEKFGFGPFIAVMPGTDNLIQSFGGGVMFALRRAKSSNSFNLGLGAMMNPNQQVLGDGIVENQPLASGESGIRYKTVTAWGYILICSFSF
jgi:hypothetical protein